MDRQSQHSPKGLAHQQTIKETIESVANKLVIIGDDLSQSYELFSGSRVVRTNSCAVLEGCMDIFVLFLKASR